jgi:hypothetical protein
MANATIHARIGVATFFLHSLASLSRKAYGTCASETIDEVCANASILARIGAAFIDIRLAMTTRETGHANAAKPSTFIDARSLVLARIRFTLVNVHLTATALKTRQAIASVGAGHVHTGTTMFTRRAFITFVDVNVALGTNVAAGATACITTVDHARLAD